MTDNEKKAFNEILEMLDAPRIEPHTLNQIGKMFGISRVRVHQILNRSIEKIKKKVNLNPEIAEAFREILKDKQDENHEQLI